MTNEKRLCRECFNEIHPKARRCAECGSRQGRFRLIDNLSTVISVLAAIFSSLVATWSWTREHAWPQGDELEYRLRGVDSTLNELSVLVSNKGDRAGAILRAEVILPSAATKDYDAMSLLLQLPPDTVIGPGQMKTVAMRATSELPAPSGPLDHSATFKLVLSVLHHNGTTERKEITFPGRLR